MSGENSQFFRCMIYVSIYCCEGIPGQTGISGNPGAPGIPGVDGCNGTDGNFSYDISYCMHTCIHQYLKRSYVSIFAQFFTCGHFIHLFYFSFMKTGPRGIPGLAGVDGPRGFPGVEGARGDKGA